MVEQKLQNDNMRKVGEGMKTITGCKRKGYSFVEVDAVRANQLNLLFNRFDSLASATIDCALSTSLPTTGDALLPGVLARVRHDRVLGGFSLASPSMVPIPNLPPVPWEIPSGEISSLMLRGQFLTPALSCPVILQAFCPLPHESAEQERMYLLCFLGSQNLRPISQAHGISPLLFLSALEATTKATQSLSNALEYTLGSGGYCPGL
ncbi:hypothetical protein QTP86_016509 [Hemibagrus guttatus]|nr:hypothetical protein QTP86_016509 [Hemibagrus guttatus]